VEAHDAQEAGSQGRDLGRDSARDLPRDLGRDLPQPCSASVDHGAAAGGASREGGGAAEGGHDAAAGGSGANSTWRTGLLGQSLGLGKDATHEAEAKDAKHVPQPHAALQAQVQAGPDSILVVGLQDESRTADYAARLGGTLDATGGACDNGGDKGGDNGGDNGAGSRAARNPEPLFPAAWPGNGEAANGHDGLMQRIGGEDANGHGHAQLGGQCEPTPLDLDEALQDAGPATSVPLPWCKKSYVRILVQAMEELGYRNSAAALEREAGVRLKSDIVTQLQDAVLQGRWEEVEVLARRGELGLSARQEALCRFVVKRQLFLELLEEDSVSAAMECLQVHLTPLATRAGQDKEELHKLARLLVSSNAGPLYTNAHWPYTGALGGKEQRKHQRKEQRKEVLAQVNACLPPVCLIPPRRLQTLVSQSLDYQMKSCRRYNRAQEWTNLLQDCHAPDGHDQLPRRTVHLLEQHSDEVWHIEFSHCGGFLASGSKDTTVIIWSLQSPAVVKHHLKGHSGQRACMPGCVCRGVCAVVCDLKGHTGQRALR